MRALKPQRVLFACCSLFLLAACSREAWKQHADVRAAEADCAGLAAPQDYACVEAHAVASRNPDVCRLVGIWVDDMCLQAVYQAAGDPAVCDRLYLEGVRPTCRAYYAVRALGLASTPSPALPTWTPVVAYFEETTLPATALAFPDTPSTAAVETPALAPTATLPPTAVPPPTPASTPTATPDPLFGGIMVAGIQLTGPGEGWAVTNPWQRGGNWPLTTGVIYRLTAGRWDPVPAAPIIPGAYACYTALSATAADDVWAVGLRGGVYACSHGGELAHGYAGQWQRFDLDPVLLAHRAGTPSPGFRPLDIQMLDAEHGWIVGGQTILRHEGGAWSVELGLDCCMADFASVGMTSRTQGWAGGVCGLYRYDQGAWTRWEDPAFDHVIVEDLQATGPDEAYAVASTSASCAVGGDTPAAQVWRYADGRWEPISPQFGGVRLSALKMVSADEGWAVGEQGATFGSSGQALALHYRAGQWELVPVPSDRPLLTVDALDAEEAWAGGDGFYRYTPTTGWVRVEAGAPLPLIRGQGTVGP